MSFHRLLILLPLVSSLIGRGQNDDLHFDAGAAAWKNISASIQLIHQDRTAAVAGRIAYPLIRENPLPNITSRKEFGQVYNRLFDSSLKRVLAG